MTEHTQPEEPQNEPLVARMVGPATPHIRIPIITLALVGLNLLMALVQVAASGFDIRLDQLSPAPVDWALGAKVPTLIAHGEYWRLVTANFLHGDWGHIFFNMLALLVIGRIVEAYYGPTRMFVIFVLSAVLGVVASYAWTPSVSLGASTGIMGLMGALIAHNIRYRRYLPAYAGPVIAYLIAFVVLQFGLDVANQQQVDIAGHFGGFVGGVVMGLLLEGRIAGRYQRERDWLPLPTALATALLLLAYGGYGLVSTLPREVDLLRAGTARNAQTQILDLQRAVDGRPYFVEARLELAELLVRAGREEEAARYYKDARANHRISGYVEQQLNRLGFRELVQAQQAFNAGQWEVALAGFRRAANLCTDPELRAGANNGYAWTLVDKLNRDLPEAERRALAAVDDQPHEAPILDTLAWVYYKQGRYQEALDRQLASLSAATEAPRQGFLNPAGIAPEQMAEMNYHLGAIYEKLGKRAEARDCYARSLRAHPTYQPAADALKRMSTHPPTPEEVPEPSRSQLPTMI